MRLIMRLMCLLLCVGAFACGALFALMSHPWLTSALRVTITVTQPSIVLDDSGAELMRFQLHKRDPVPLQRIPPHVVAAFLATEDRRFYEHPGISWWGIVRSFAHNIYYQRFGQGASTITQQLVRLIFFDTRKTLRRKIQEQLLALIIERQMTKDQIMEAYLNHVYLGCGMYGIAAAATQLWGKSVEALTVAEAALIAGIVKSPRTYCPLLQPDNALKRRAVVLSCMAHAGYLSRDDAQRLSKEPLSLHQEQKGAEASYLMDMVRRELEGLVNNKRLYEGGLTIKTTINAHMQHDTERVCTTTLGSMRARDLPTVNGAVVTLDVATGAIKALVGGYSYEQSQFNRATQATRQVGSGIKPLLYATALELGYPLNDIALDEPTVFTDHGHTWEPVNVTKRFDGPMTRARALIVSNNIIAAKTLELLGPQTLINRLSPALPQAAWKPYLSLSLGCIDISPLDAAALWNTLANRGRWCEPHLIDWVKNRQGTTMWKYKPHELTLFTWSTTSTIVRLLEQAHSRWQHMLHLAPFSCAAMGKTGTTNDARNCWFLGSTPTYTTAVYLGSDDYRSLPTMLAVRNAFPLWHACVACYPQPQQQFAYDPRLTERCINGFTGESTAPDDPDRILLLEPPA